MPEKLSNQRLPAFEYIPERLLEGAAIVNIIGPARVTCDRAPARTVFMGQGAALTRLRAAEGAVSLINHGVPVAHAMEFGLTLIERDDHVTLAICSELADNPGTSVTNAWPGLADFLCARFDLDPGRTLFVEHYGAFSYTGAPMEPDRFDQVEIDWRGGKANLIGWQPVRRQDLRVRRP